MANAAHAENQAEQVTETVLSPEQAQRLNRMKERLMKRGFDEADAEEEAASWIKMNRVFDTEEAQRATA